MLKRILSACFGAVLFGIAVPTVYLLLFSFPGSAMVLAGVVASGVLLGAALGIIFPKVFGFIFEMAFGI